MVSTIPITSPAFFAGARQAYGVLSNKFVENAGELTSGRRVLDQGKDSASLSSTLRLRAQIVDLQQSSKNVAYNDSLASVATDALTDIQTLLQDAAELADEASGTALSNTDRTFYQQQITSIFEEIDTIATSTTFDNRTLLDGSFDDVEIRVGPGENDLITLTIPDASSNALFSGSLPDITSPANAAVAVTQFETALETVGNAIGDLNGLSGRLLTANDNVNTTLTGLESAVAGFENVDVASKQSEFAIQEVQINIAAAVIAQTQRLSSDLLNVLDFNISENTGQKSKDDALSSAKSSLQSSAESNVQSAQQTTS